MIDGLAELAARCGTVVERDRVVRAGEGLRGTALLEGRRGRRTGVLLLATRHHSAPTEAAWCYTWTSALVLVDGEAHPRWIDASRLVRVRRHAERGWPPSTLARVEQALRARRA